MSRFSADWLSLREGADARARSTELLTSLPAHYPAIVDLGAGTGANLRWLAPQLAGRQRWALLDHDASLLATAGAEIGNWARRLGYRADGDGNQVVITGPDCDYRVETFAIDLSASLHQLELPAGCLLTASALLDLVSRDWLERLVARVAASGACVLWALSYSGSVAIDPSTPDDDAIIALVNRHQLTDKGFGPALGPEAWILAQRLLERAGLRVRAVDSSWELGADDAELIRTLLGGWADAAIDIAPGDQRLIRQWQQLRLGQAAAGTLRVSVSHRDLAARPQTAARP